MATSKKPLLTEEQAFEKYKSERLPLFLKDEANSEMRAKLTQDIILVTAPQSATDVMDRLANPSKIGLFGSRSTAKPTLPGHAVEIKKGSTPGSSKP